MTRFNTDDSDFLRGDEIIVEKAARAVVDAPDVHQSHSDESWDTINGLAWRPAWSIRSRRGVGRFIRQWWVSLFSSK